MKRLSPVRYVSDGEQVQCYLLAAVMVLGLVLAGPVLADTDWKEFYQFRHSSTLPGNMFGVSPAGQVGFDGALQQNVPVAYTPSADNWVIGYSSGSNTGSVEIGFGGGGVNGTGFIGLGVGRPGHGVYGSWMMTGSDIAEAYNFQCQLVDGGQRGWALAVGVQDILNQRDDYAGDPYGARSIYGVATRPLDLFGDSYLTVGWGDGRFGSSPFGGLSVPVTGGLRLVTEYDGMQVNAGLALSALGRSADEYSERQRWIALGYFGYSGLDRPVVGLVITKH
ncbi:MAG: hypothetical protein KAW89_09170 [Armatimonadetes bacterium]|nr:hypothetical protein [Armatimonadota bacterium]